MTLKGKNCLSFGLKFKVFFLSTLARVDLHGSIWNLFVFFYLFCNRSYQWPWRTTWISKLAPRMGRRTTYTLNPRTSGFKEWLKQRYVIHLSLISARRFLRCRVPWLTLIWTPPCKAFQFLFPKHHLFYQKIYILYTKSI